MALRLQTNYKLQTIVLLAVSIRNRKTIIRNPKSTIRNPKSLHPLVKKLAQQTAIYGVSSILARFLNYALVPIQTRVFHPAEFGVVTQFDDNWDRTFTLEGTPQGRFSIRQHLSLMTPHYARVDSRRHNWSPHYLMTEFDPSIVRSLLLAHPDLKKNGKDDH